jgi:ferredoxin-NADP reductase
MTLPTSISAVLGLIFVLTGGAAVWLMLHASGRGRSLPQRDRVIQAHRIAGYVFVALFCMMTWFMILKTRDIPDELSIRPMFHIVIALVMAPLIIVKVLIARYYKAYQGALVPLGLTIFILGFVLVGSTAGPYFFRTATMKDISLASVNMGAARIDLQASGELMQKRCSRCHALDRVVGARKDARDWLTTVNRMRALPSSGISEVDAKTILSYLLTVNSIDSSSAEGELTLGKALVDSHCNRCHALDRTYQAAKSPSEWQTTVARMVRYARGASALFNPGEEERVVRFLSITQTPEAVEKRRLGANDSTHEIPSAPISPPKAAASVAIFRYGLTAGALIVISLVFGKLMVSRPHSGLDRSAPPMAASDRDAGSRADRANDKTSLVLELIRIERTTHDSATLRFRIPNRATYRAKPGQFLTFEWLFKGSKTVRSYSISSSPAQTGYLEITVKKQENGCVSAFLNDKAAVGLTVEARGPSGQFYFDEKVHRRIVLFAGGSGITPIISILRYIDDLCLDVKATLVYSVRSEADIIFDKELQVLAGRLHDFDYVLALTRPGVDWKGPRGRLTRELVAATVGDIVNTSCFVCGPEPFMDNVNTILKSLGVDPANIKREKFGGPRAQPGTGTTPLQTGAVIEFARSGVTFPSPAGRTLLEAAEMNGIDIAYSCRQGQCGTCTTRLLDGSVTMESEDGLQPELKARGYILPCVARPVGDLRLDA